MTLELPQTMRAVEISEFGAPNVLKMVERPVPEATHGQVVIRVAYAGVNRPDALQRAGLMRRPKAQAICRGLRHLARSSPSVQASRAGPLEIRCARFCPAGDMQNMWPLRLRTVCRSQKA